MNSYTLLVWNTFSLKGEKKKITLEKSFVLPFVPFYGLHLEEKSEERKEGYGIVLGKEYYTDGESYITGIVYDYAKKRFEVNLNTKIISKTDLLEVMKRFGWTEKQS